MLPRGEDFRALATDERFLALRKMLSSVSAVYRTQTESMAGVRKKLIEAHPEKKHKGSEVGKQRVQVLGTDFAGAPEPAPAGATKEELAEWKRRDLRRRRCTKSAGREHLGSMWDRPVRTPPDRWLQCTPIRMPCYTCDRSL